MSLIKAIRDSYFFNMLIWIKDLASNSFLFSIRKFNRDNTFRVNKEYTSWIDSSLIYKILMSLEGNIRRLESLLYDSIANSRILTIINSRLLNRINKPKIRSNNPLLNNSYVYNWLAKAVEATTMKDILLILTVLYIFVDTFIRKVSILSAVSPIWDELLLIILYIYIIFKRIASKGNIRYNYTPMGLPAALFILAGIIHVMIIAPELSIAIEGYRAVFQQVFWYFALTQLIRNTEDSKKAINLMIGMGLFLGLHATYQYVAKVPMLGNWVDVSENVRTRAYSIVGSPNILGSLFVLLIPLAVSMFFTNKDKRLKSFYLISGLFMLLGLFFTMSRGAWLAFGFSVFIFIIMINPKFILHFTVLGIGLLLLGGSMSQRLLYILTPTYLSKSATDGRLYRWKVGFELWKENKAFGVGLGRFGGAVAINNNLAPFYMDNYYLKTMTEMGLFGIFAMAFVILCFIISTVKIIRFQEDFDKELVVLGLFVGGIGVLVQNFVENIFEVPAMIIYFWTLIALIATYIPQKGQFIKGEGGALK